MTQRWAVAVAFTGMLGCQLDGERSGSELQAESDGACTAVLPAATTYAGQPLPIAGPRQIWVVTKSAVTSNTLGALVDTDAGQVVAMLDITPGMLGTFTSGISTFQAVFPGHPNPPPPVSPVTPSSQPPVDPAWLVFAGTRAVEGFAAAQENARNCATAPTTGCNAKLPPETTFSGQPLPTAGPGQIWVIAMSSVKDELLAALVEPDAVRILAIIRIPSGLVGRTTNGVSPFLGVFTGHPNPPPPVSPVTPPASEPALDPSWLMFVGQQALHGFVAAQEEARGCSSATP